MKEEVAKTIIEKFGFKDKDLITEKHDKIILWLRKPENFVKVLTGIGLLEQGVRIYRGCNYSPVCDWDWNKKSCSAICTNDWSMWHWETDCENLIEKAKEKIKPSRAEELIFKSARENLIEEVKEAYEILNSKLSLVEKSKKYLDFLIIEGKIEKPIMSGYNNNYNLGFIDYSVTLRNKKLSNNYFFATFWKLKFPLEEVIKKVNIEIKTELESVGEVIRQINMYRSHEDGAGTWILILGKSTKDEIKEAFKGENIFIFDFEEIENDKK